MPLVSKTFGDIITFTRASSATFTGSNGLIQSATTNTPRFDYDPVTLAAKGLLIEEQRTNLATYSEDFSNAAWTKGVNVTITDNAAVAPDGATTADLIASSSSTNSSLNQVFQQATVGSSATYTASFWVRAVGANQNIVIRQTANAVLVADTTVAVTSSWQRVSATFTASTNPGFAIRPDGVSNLNIYIWGAQLEAGAFATSYIPTVASQVTRSADVASVNTLSPWYNATEGTLFASVSGFSAGAAFSALAAITDNPVSSNWVQISGVTASTAATVVSGGVSQANLTSLPSVSSGGSVAIAYKANDFAAVVNGGTVATDVAGSVPSGVSVLRIGGFGSNPGPTNGHIRRITYYPRRLSNAELVSITA